MTAERDNFEMKMISLLRYALNKKGVSEASYFIGNDGDEVYQDDVLCLLRSSLGEWTVLYTERGIVSQRVRHPNLHGALTDFYWKLTRKDTPWDFRLAWEKETGHQL